MPGFTSGPGGAPPPYSSDEPNPFSFMPYKAEEPTPPSKAEEGWGKKKKKGEKNKIAQTPRTGKDAEVRFLDLGFQFQSCLVVI